MKLTGGKTAKTTQWQPSANNPKSGDIYRRLLTYVWPYWRFLMLGVVAMVINSAIDAGFTWSLKPLLNRGFIDRDQVFIQWLPWLVIFAFIIRGSVSFLGGYCIKSISRDIIMMLRQQIFAKLLRLPARFYDQTPTGTLLSTLIYNVDQVSEAGANTLVTIVRESFFILGLLVVMFSISWQITCLFFIAAPFIAFIANLSSSKMRRYGRKLQSGMGDITHFAEEVIEGYRVIRTFGGEDYEKEKFNRATGQNRRREVQMIITNNLASPLVQVIIAIAIAFTVYLGTHHIGNISAGGFASILAAMLAILKPLKNITTINNVIQKGVVGAEGVFHLLDQAEENATGQQRLARAKGALSLRALSFAYQDSVWVLNNIDITIKPGMTVALVGRSGSGKSTLVNLLPRFYEDYQGDIYMDEINTRDIYLPDLRRQFAFVSQRVTLFNDTIRNNIAYGQYQNHSDETIIKTLQAANAWDFIKNLPQGLDTYVGENGLLLSGGKDNV
jgi:subfamily B ATP-binding cassette protein MsbA